MFRRYAIFHVPSETALADLGARWFGWDICAGRSVARVPVPEMPVGVEEVTATPRKYGLHGTLKAPFRLASGTTVEALSRDLEDLAQILRPAASGGLRPKRLSQFWALVPGGDTSEISALAAALVEALDHHRAPLTEAETARRRRSPLTPEEERLLQLWGYPYVMDRFRFHLTLTGAMPERETPAMEAVLDALWRPLCAPRFVIDRVALVGEGEDGMFRLIRQVQLRG